MILFNFNFNLKRERHFLLHITCFCLQIQVHMKVIFKLHVLAMDKHQGLQRTQHETSSLRIELLTLRECDWMEWMTKSLTDDDTHLQVKRCTEWYPHSSNWHEQLFNRRFINCNLNFLSLALVSLPVDCFSLFSSLSLSSYRAGVRGNRFKGKRRGGGREDSLLKSYLLCLRQLVCEAHLENESVPAYACRVSSCS